MKERKERSSSWSPSLISPSENFPREIFFFSPDPLSVTPKNHMYKKNYLKKPSPLPCITNPSPKKYKHLKTLVSS
jgi:hypothetical protein